MAKRQREWAKRARLALIAALGGKCVDCESTTNLEIDHIEPARWARNGIDQSRRVSRYRAEAKEGKLTVRCKPCNVRKGNYVEIASAPEVPF